MKEGKVQQDQPGLKVSGECNRKGLQHDVIWKTVYTLQQQRSGG